MPPVGAKMAHVLYYYKLLKLLKRCKLKRVEGEKYPKSFLGDLGNHILCLHHYSAVALSLCMLISSSSVCVYLLIPQCRALQTRTPTHRKELNPCNTDDIIKLLNEIAVPLVEWVFSGMELYNKIPLWVNAHTHTHVGAVENTHRHKHTGCWQTCNTLLISTLPWAQC